MSSTYSTNLAIELMGTGDQAGTWGTTTNTNLGTLIEQAISGYVTQAVATGTDTTITIPNGASGTARNMFIELTGTGGASTNLIVPNNKKLYFVYNNTSSGQVTVKVSGQTGVSVANGTKVILVSNGTDIVNATSYSTTTGTVTGSGTTNYVTKFTGSTAVGNSVIYDDGTNVGIGTSSPATKLEVSGSAAIARITGTSASVPQLSLSSAGVVNWSLRSNNDSGSDFTIYQDSTQRLKIDSSGNAGIGTSSPGAKLDVYGGASGTVTNVQVGNASTAFLLGVDGSNNCQLRTAQSVNMLFYTAGSERARIDSSGNLLVGTTSTSSLAASGRGLIEVNGSSDSAFAMKAAGTLYGYLYNSSSEFRVANATANPVTFFTNNSERARIDSSGNLLVGTTTSGNKLYVAGGASTPVVAVTFSATAMTVNCQLSNTFSTTFTANVTTAPTISNPSDGQTINWFITQDATGSRTMTWPASFKWAGGTAGVLSTAANSVDLVVATYRSATGFWYVSLSKAFS